MGGLFTGFTDNYGMGPGWYDPAAPGFYFGLAPGSDPAYTSDPLWAWYASRGASEDQLGQGDPTMGSFLSLGDIGGGGGGGLGGGGFTIDLTSGLPVASGGGGGGNTPSDGPLPNPAQESLKNVLIKMGLDVGTAIAIAKTLGVGGGASAPGGVAVNTSTNYPDPTKGTVDQGTTVDPVTGQKKQGSLLNQIANAGLAATPLLAGLLGSIGAYNQQDLLNTANFDVLNNLREQQGKNFDQAQAIQNPLLASLLPYMQQNLAAAGPQFTRSSDAIGAGLSNLGSFLTPTELSRVPGLQGVLDFNGGLAQGGHDAAATLLGQLGQSQPGSDTGVMRALQLALGQGAYQQGPADVGMGVLGAGGQTDYTKLLQQYGADVLGNQGQTGQLAGISDAAAQLLNGAGGGTAGALQSLGLRLAGQNPLLPTNEAVSLTRNAAATAARQKNEALLRQLMNRTGVGGPVVASGQQNELLSTLGDDALKAEADALQQTLFNQQQLGLQQQGLGGSLASSGLGGQQSTQNTALNALLAAAGQAAGRESNLANLGLGAQGAANNLFATGGSLLNNFNNQSLGGLQALTSLLSQGTSNTTGTANALANLLNTSGNLTQNQAGNLFNLQGLGQTSTNNMYNALSGLTGQNLNLANLLQQGGQQSANNLSDILGKYLQGNQSATAAQTGVFGSPTPQNYLNLGR